MATARLALAIGALGLIGGLVWGKWGPWAGAALGILAVAFAGLVVVHAHIDEARERALAAARFHARGLARMALRWADLPLSTGQSAPPDHPFASDLDIFGHASLMQAMNATETRLGEERLAAWLSLESSPDWPAGAAARARAARELSGRVAFREALAAAAGVLADERPDPSALVAWAEEKADAVPAALAIAAWVLPASAIALVVFGRLFGVPAGARTAVVIATMAAGLATGSRYDRVLTTVSSRESAATRWRATLRAIEDE
ncbi:MAG: hypothetical protein FWD17_05230, partial [Polyangiaceae bacterium]|nr:hypothetical protein [Polyangiaceae bacterium]